MRSSLEDLERDSSMRSADSSVVWPDDKYLEYFTAFRYLREFDPDGDSFFLVVDKDSRRRERCKLKVGQKE